ncbi:hypothetical protein [Helicobacter pylori]|uniref:hypothetical protein n=1 Tax=Helicobacter pylori TaxID=210 RepID=UPI002159EC3F|nr:hypothetical protein [Helicobacter pylori]
MGVCVFFVKMRQKNVFEARGKNEKHLSNATKKPMLFFMLPKSPPLRKKEKREKKERLKKSKNNLIRKQRYGRFLTNRLTTRELSKMGLLMKAKEKA